MTRHRQAGQTAIVRTSSQWRWKDEDEFESAISRGLISPERAVQIRAEGLRALSLLQQGQPPFDHEWTSWRPDPAWPRPELPKDGNRPGGPYA